MASNHSGHSTPPCAFTSRNKSAQIWPKTSLEFGQADKSLLRPLHPVAHSILKQAEQVFRLGFIPPIPTVGHKKFWGFGATAGSDTRRAITSQKGIHQRVVNTVCDPVGKGFDVLQRKHWADGKRNGRVPRFQLFDNSAALAGQWRTGWRDRGENRVAVGFEGKTDATFISQSFDVVFNVQDKRRPGLDDPFSDRIQRSQIELLVVNVQSLRKQRLGCWRSENFQLTDVKRMGGITAAGLHELVLQ